MYFQFGRLLQVDNSIKTHLTYEMGYTPKEFKKTLQGLFISQTLYSCKEFSSTHWEITVEKESTIVDINIEEAPPRIIAQLTLPVLKVSFQFKDSSQNQQASFMKTFFRFFHKGGG